MRLLARLLLGIVAVVVLCLAVTTGWILHDTHHRIEAATAISADRAVDRLRALYWQELLWRDGLNRAELLPVPDWRSLATVRVIAPGICIGYVPTGQTAPPRLCSEAEDDYPAAPGWFETLYRNIYGAFPEVRRPLDVRQNAGLVTAGADPETVLRLAWLQVGLMVRTAAALAAAVGLLVAALVIHTLLPVRAIIAGMRRLEDGDYAHRIGRRGDAELGDIAGAVNDLAARLARTDAARSALTRQLFRSKRKSGARWPATSTTNSANAWRRPARWPDRSRRVRRTGSTFGRTRARSPTRHGA